MKAHFVESECPVESFHGPVMTVCEKKIQRPQIVMMWDELLVGTDMTDSIGRLPNTCTNCYTGKRANGYIYAVIDTYKESK